MLLQMLQSALLFILAVPVVFKYRILPIEGTPYWLFGILFLILIVNIISSFTRNTNPHSRLFFWAVFTVVIVGVTWTAIIDRHLTAPVYGVHDIILQQEAAMRYLLSGKNPYKETYFGTLLESWHYDELGKTAVNPALYHFVMPPWYLIFPFFFYALSLPILGFFDGRIPLLFCLTAAVLLLGKWYRNKNLGTIAMTLLAFAPGAVDYFIEGRSDMFALSWFIASIYLLDKKRFLLSPIFLGLALLSKQSIWLAVLFYFPYLFWILKKDIKKFINFILITIAVIILFTSPFVAWSPGSFLDSVIFYLSGNTAHSYPVSGYGFSMILMELGVIKNIHESYPFIIWQLVTSIPLAIILLKWLRNNLRVSALLLSYSLVLFVFWYFSRYFNNSHIIFIATLVMLAVLKEADSKLENTKYV